ISPPPTPGGSLVSASHTWRLVSLRLPHLEARTSDPDELPCPGAEPAALQRGARRVVAEDGEPEPDDAEPEREGDQVGDAEAADVKAEKAGEERVAGVTGAAERAAEGEVDGHERLRGSEHADEGERIGDDRLVVHEQAGDRAGGREDDDPRSGHHREREPDRRP